MHIIEKLLENAERDTELLTIYDGKGDKFDLPRDVKFSLKTPEKEQAEIVRDFINENRYGDATVSSEDPEDEGMHSIHVTVNMPITQQVLCSVSALMECLAQLFDNVEYDGWGCVLQTTSTTKMS